MGSVWLAHHLQLDTDLAVKFINVDQSATSGGRARFEREAKAAALLHGPNVVEVHDYGVDDGLPYLVMEFLRGEDLSRRLAREVRLAPLLVVNLVSQVARALRRAHEAGIVHRDLKPGNIYLVERDDDEEPLVKVLDFGIARTPRLGLEGDATKTGTILGSPRYMSPEQARAPRSVDPRSDLWSVAVIAYRGLTGRLPFLGEEITELLLQICSESAPAPSSVAPDLGTEFDAFFEKAFARDPNDRFQTARELAAELAFAAGVQPTSLRRASRSTDRPPSEPAISSVVPRQGSTDLVAIATIAPDLAPRGGPVESTRASAEPPPPSGRVTVPEGRPRAYSVGEGTLTQAPRTLDVALRAPSPRATSARVWATAIAVGLAGLMLGAFVALNLLSPAPVTPAAAVQLDAASVLVGPPPLEAIATASPEASPPALVAPAPTVEETSKKPQPTRPPATPNARPRPAGRRNPTLGI